MATTRTIPPLLTGSTIEKVATLQRRERDLAWRVRYPFEALFLDWRQRLEHFFLSHFLISTRPDRQKHWDLVVANRYGFQEQLVQPFFATLSAVEREVVDLAAEEEEDAYLLGALYGRWQLSLGGLEDDTQLPTFALVTFAGLTVADRARQWGRVYRDKLRRATRGMLVGQHTLPDSLALLDALLTQYTSRMSALVQNEVYHAAQEGERQAILPYTSSVLQVWITADDEKVCPICWALHKTITHKIPIRDTHPVCRCVKIPLVRSFQPRPSSFAAFTDRYAS